MSAPGQMGCILMFAFAGGCGGAALPRGCRTCAAVPPAVKVSINHKLSSISSSWLVPKSNGCLRCRELRARDATLYKSANSCPHDAGNHCPTFTMPALVAPSWESASQMTPRSSLRCIVSTLIIFGCPSFYFCTVALANKQDAPPARHARAAPAPQVDHCRVAVAYDNA